MNRTAVVSIHYGMLITATLLGVIMIWLRKFVRVFIHLITLLCVLLTLIFMIETIFMISSHDLLGILGAFFLTIVFAIATWVCITYGLN